MPAIYLCKFKNCPYHEKSNQYGDCCMEKDKHDHTPLLVQKVIDEIVGKSQKIYSFVEYIHKSACSLIETNKELIDYLEIVVERSNLTLDRTI